MQDFEPKQQIYELLNGYRSVDSSFPGRVAKALDGVSEDLHERAKVAGDLTEQVETIRQERETEVHNICQSNRKLELTALTEIRTFAVQALSIIEEIILRRDGSRDFARAGEDLYEQSGASRRLIEGADWPPSDEFTRQCVAIRVERQLRSEQVLATHWQAMTTYGIPEHIRSDNGTEFIAQKIQAWLRENQIKTLYIDPGSPW